MSPDTLKLTFSGFYQVVFGSQYEPREKNWRTPRSHCAAACTLKGRAGVYGTILLMEHYLKAGVWPPVAYVLDSVISRLA